eukprot:TRINITY_DN50435_c0_g1_i3.p1 TRINITY_DN50435_c0_g1~~TRINITY_DN50435_c0_g1_i3.p1  ORF type:complete len:322 (-),score=13.70 TRINITY_DN50435_c0_g1_i3:95-1060(-)
MYKSLVQMSGEKCRSANGVKEPKLEDQNIFAIFFSDLSVSYACSLLLSTATAEILASGDLSSSKDYIISSALDYHVPIAHALTDAGSRNPWNKREQEVLLCRVRKLLATSFKPLTLQLDSFCWTKGARLVAFWQVAGDNLERLRADLNVLVEQSVRERCASTTRRHATHQPSSDVPNISKPWILQTVLARLLVQPTPQQFRRLLDAAAGQTVHCVGLCIQCDALSYVSNSDARRQRLHIGSFSSVQKLSLRRRIRLLQNSWNISATLRFWALLTVLGFAASVVGVYRLRRFIISTTTCRSIFARCIRRGVAILTAAAAIAE